jgi:hypothetical protein
LSKTKTDFLTTISLTTDFLSEVLGVEGSGEGTRSRYPESRSSQHGSGFGNVIDLFVG